MKKILYSLLLLINLLSQLYGQSVFEESEDTFAPPEINLIDEKINRISHSKRIFIITNSSNGFNDGDYISFVLEDKLVARAIVAKQNDGLAGVKILKIYSLSLWRRMKPGLDIKIIRGDDSYFGKKEEKSTQELAESKIVTEDDLFNETTLLEDDISLDEENKSLIKTDNLLGISFGQINSVGIDGSDQSYIHYIVHYANQIHRNIWFQAGLGYTLLNDYPQVTTDSSSNGLDTSLYSFNFRLKYTFSAPYYSYVMPYIAYQITSAASDGAGDTSTGLSASTAAEELEQVEALEGSEIAFGVSFLKRLVPGWFITADLGTDYVNVGFTLEF